MLKVRLYFLDNRYTVVSYIMQYTNKTQESTILDILIKLKLA